MKCSACWVRAAWARSIGPETRVSTGIVAIKILGSAPALNSTARERFERESQTISA